MKRREFITLLSGAAATWPMAARAQQPAMPVIGYLSFGTPQMFPASLAAFHAGLKQSGFVEGQNVAIDYRWAEEQGDRLPALAAELVRRQVAVIVAAGTTQDARAAKAATATIPIVFSIAADPVELGLVSSLNRPGGNLTGSTRLNADIAPKRLEVLHELVPTASAIALLVNPTDPTLAEAQSKDVQTAARTLGLQLHVLHASTERDFETVFATMVQLRAGALVIGTNSFLSARVEQLAALALRYRIPAIHQIREFPLAGGLVSYGTSSRESYRVVGAYTGRILKGEKPADLPVQQSTKVELTINIKTAKALGLTVSLPLLGRADEVIE